jgi:hypothetical protein
MLMVTLILELANLQTEEKKIIPNQINHGQAETIATTSPASVALQELQEATT